MGFSNDAFIFASIVTILIAIVGYFTSRRRKEKEDKAAFAEAVRQELHIPPTLHPIIDPKACIGSLSCLKVCPEGDILGVIDGKAALITGANCIGHGRCELECPVDAIKLVFGTEERGVDLPQIDEFFESSRPGVHIIGELGGMGLVKNAMTQGVQLSKRLSGMLKPSKDPKVSDVLIVGAGPAGIALALGLRKEGLSFRMVDQEVVGGTVAHYPRQKLVMMDRIDLPLYGKFGKPEISKEELIESFEKMLKKAQVTVQSGTKVAGIDGKDGQFLVHTSQGEIRTRKVVLACGRRGSPRKLGVEGENLEKVTYRLIDPEQYAGKHVLVVGGGDSALEAAIAMADQPNTKVTISYRNPAFGRCRPANKEKIESLIASKKVQALFNSTTTKVEPKSVHLTVNGTAKTIQNDYVIVCIGGELPLEFLKSVGVEVKRHFGSAPEKKRRSAHTTSGFSRVASEELAQERKRRTYVQAYFITGGVILTVLTLVGWKYYILPPTERVRSPLHASLRPGGLWGHGVGIVATLVMLSNFLYVARKRWRFLKGRSTIKNWLTFHMFVGFMSPLVIIFHAAFQSNNIFATMTFLGLLVVVATGIIGRFIFTLLPVSGDKTLQLAELLSRFEQHKSSLRPILETAKNPKPMRNVIHWMTSTVENRSALSLITHWPADYIRLRWGLMRARGLFPQKENYYTLRDELFRILQLRRQLSSHKVARKLIATWRMFHVVLAIFLVILIGIHIYITVYYGYRWIF